MPVPLKMIRQRYVLAADQVFTLSSVDVESPKHAMVLRPSPLSFSACAGTTSAVVHDVDSVSARSQRWVSWRHKIEDCLWLASAFFILYYGDFRSDFFTLLANDARVWRTPLHMGLACLMLDGCMVLLYMAVGGGGEGPHDGVMGAATMLGSLAFILMSVALWPIWNILTVPMLFTLSMALAVVAPYLLPKVKLDLACPRCRRVPASSCQHDCKPTSSS